MTRRRRARPRRRRDPGRRRRTGASSTCPAWRSRAGDRIAIVGPNGAGKSTLLRCLTGVLEPRRRRRPPGRRARSCDATGGTVARTIAVVPELAQLPFEMAVEDVVALGRLPHEPPLTGLRPRTVPPSTPPSSGSGSTHLRGRDVRDLSMGERQLVFIALALAQEAPILVLDEPTAHLDIRHQVEVMQLLVDLNERDGTTVIAVLHDLALAAHFFDRVVVMADGRIVADGPPAVDARRRPDPGGLRGRPGARPAAGMIVARRRPARRHRAADAAARSRVPADAAPRPARRSFPLVGLGIGAAGRRAGARRRRGGTGPRGDRRGRAWRPSSPVASTSTASPTRPTP